MKKEQSQKRGLSEEQRRTMLAGFRFNNELPTEELRTSQVALNASTRKIQQARQEAMQATSRIH